MTALEMVKAKLVGTDYERYISEENLLKAYINDAQQQATSIVYPFDETATLPDIPKYHSWVARATIEMIMRRGAEGQLAHNENGINRTYDGGVISQSLINELTPKGKILKR